MPSPPLFLASVTVSAQRAQSIEIPISLLAHSDAQIVDTRALIDSGATGNFIDRDLVKRRGYTMKRLPTPL